MIRKGDRVKIKKEWQDPGDEHFVCQAGLPAVNSWAPALAYILANLPARAPDPVFPFEVRPFFEFANARGRFANLPVDVTPACKTVRAIGLRIRSQRPPFANCEIRRKTWLV
jgi:hypothetical protein